MNTASPRALTCAALVSAGLAQPAMATSQPAAAAGEAWQYEVTPHLLAAGMEGTIGVRGYATPLDVSFGDIAENLDAGFMGLFTAQKGPWSLGMEGVYMKLSGGKSGTVTGPGGVVQVGGRLDIDYSMYIAQASVGYRVLDEKTKVDLIGAVRWTKLETDVSVVIPFPGPIFGGAASASGSEDWVDGVVAVRVLHPVGDKVSLLGYSDVGAGGSDLTYQVMAGVNWEYKRDFTAKVGYRYLSWDYERGGTVWDMAASGPYLGLGIRF